MKTFQICSLIGSVGLLGIASVVPASKPLGETSREFTNSAGVARTVATNGDLSFSGPFFQSLGSNGRACVTCHQPAENWGLSAEGVRRTFDRTAGLDPLFRLNDGANSPNADVSTLAKRRTAYSMLLSKGLIRVDRPIPAGAEFVLESVDDPYGYASAAGLSLFRRPLPSTNLRFVSTVMWDGRELTSPMVIGATPAVNSAILMDSLSNQALDATNGHAQAAANISLAQRQAIVDFEMGLATAQVNGNGVGSLTAQGAQGGPEAIADLDFYIGINDNTSDPAGAFKEGAMTLFDAWINAGSPHRRAVARGQAIFNNKRINITGVKGINDNSYFGTPSTVPGTCTTCHNTPNSGNHSIAIALDIGLTDGSRRTSDMPLYRLRNTSTNQVVETTDPGLALSTGLWKDIGRFKGPVLRGLAARAPYFHDGSAANLSAVIDFYSDRFGVTFTAQERSDLIAFLESL